MFIRLVTALELIHSPPHTHFWSFHALTFTPSTSRCGFSRLMDVFINLSWRFALLLLSFYTSVRGLPGAFYLPLSFIVLLYVFRSIFVCRSLDLCMYCLSLSIFCTCLLSNNFISLTYLKVCWFHCCCISVLYLPSMLPASLPIYLGSIMDIYRTYKKSID